MHATSAGSRSVSSPRLVEIMELMPTFMHRQRNTEVKTAKAKACGFKRQVQGYI